MNEETIFTHARQLKTDAERQAYLDQACAGNFQLRTEVEQLLRVDARAGSLLEHPAAYDAVTDVPGGIPWDSHMDFSEWKSILAPSSDPARPGRLGVYDVLDFLGRGGMGAVFRCHDPKLNRVVALKALVPELAANAMARKRFLREAQAAAAVNHDNVVRIYGVDDEGQVPFLVMECIIGQSLQRKIDRTGALQLTEILRIGMQIAMGLAAAHKQGLIHRDIKPSNILLENGVERVKITDFGLARAVDDVGITQSGVIAGTPQYMSPEQAMGEPLDQRSDLFSLGSLLYTMCAGRPAFRGDSTIAVIRRVCDDTPRPIRELNPEMPDWLTDVIDRLLAKDPQQRFQTAGEVAVILEQYLAQIQQAENSSGHRNLISRVPGTPPLPAAHREDDKRDADGVDREANSISDGKELRSDRIWSIVGVLALMIMVGTIFNGIWRNYLFPPTATQVVKDDNPYSKNWSNTAKSGNLDQATDPSHETAGTAGPIAIAPFDAKQAAQFQSDWAKRLDVPVEFTNGLDMKFRLIPPGEFQMGSTNLEVSELEKDLEQLNASEFDKFVARSSTPQHAVQLLKPYYLGQYEVTAAQYQKFVDATQRPAANESEGTHDWKSYVTPELAEKQPVLGVSWVDAQAFCRWLSEREGLTYDLPTEAQWEYACRAGTTTLWSTGDDVSQLNSHAMFGQKLPGAPPEIGLKAPNAFGLYDMHGNVAEWCMDWHVRDFYARSPLIEPASLEQPKDPASGRVFRGGGWHSEAWWTRSAVRGYDNPTKPAHPTGFRVVIRGQLKRP